MALSKFLEALLRRKPEVDQPEESQGSAEGRPQRPSVVPSHGHPQAVEPRASTNVPPQAEARVGKAAGTTEAKRASPIEQQPESPRRRRDLPTLYGGKAHEAAQPTKPTLPDWLRLDGPILDAEAASRLSVEIGRRRPKELLPGDMELDHFDFEGARVTVTWMNSEWRGITAQAKLEDAR